MLFVQPEVLAPAVELGTEQELEVELEFAIAVIGNRNAVSTRMRW